MDWQRFRLTSEEAKWSIKYEDPRKTQRPVLRRFYYNELNLSPTLRRDSSTFQISRRSRVLAMTFAGDVDRFAIEILNVTGEQFTTGPTHVPLLCGGYANDPRSTVSPPAGAALEDAPFLLASPSMGPYVFEPNIQVAPNQTIQINATPQNANDTTSTYILGCTLHVVELPGAPGSPL